MKIVAGTGHRPHKLGGYGVKAQNQLKQTALYGLTSLKPDRLITGMALGWDQALAYAAIELGIPFVAAVPFKSQDSRWPAECRDAYRELLSMAIDVVVVSPGSYKVISMQLRNIWMVDRCSDVLALWDGSSGGTENCIMYARQVQRPIHNMWDYFVSL